MSIESDIKTVLTNYVNLSALISNRFYIVKMPQNVTYPAGRYTRISTSPVLNIVNRSGLSSSRFQFDVWSATMSSALNIKDELINAIESSTTFSSNLINVGFSGYEDEENIYRVTIDFNIWYTGI